jgi:hypothetical protein
MLTFVKIDGVVDMMTTEGTFDQRKFVRGCVDVIRSGKVDVWPGINSI